MSAPRPLDKRLLDFAVAVCRAVRTMPRDDVGTNVARQLARSATSPAANYAEARDATSPRDYLGKMKICLRELRETHMWLQLARDTGFRNADYHYLASECNELISIVVACIKKASENGSE